MTVNEELAAARAEHAFQLGVLGPRPPWWRPILRRRWDRMRAAIGEPPTALGLAMRRLLRAHYQPGLVAALAGMEPRPLSQVRRAERAACAFCGVRLWPPVPGDRRTSCSYAGSGLVTCAAPACETAARRSLGWDR